MGYRIMIAIMAAIVSVATAVGQTTSSQPARPAPLQSEPAAVDLSTEPAPVRGAKAPGSLREAAEANDYASFDHLIRKARSNGEDLGAYADLYDIWSFAESTATGSYYGADVHNRLAARYPDYAKFIEEYRISDSHGQPFYPTAETRAFLLQQAIEGNDPLASSASRPAARPAIATPRTVVTAPAPARPAPAKPAPETRSAAAPPPIEPPETLAADALASDMSKVVAPQAPAAPPKEEKPIEAEVVDTTATTRGIFLIILGLIGIGVLTVTMRAPSSESHLADEEPHASASKSHG